MKNKKGISLIVLSITILVMVILAATAVITLENSGIIGRSKTAVTKQQLAEENTRLTVIKNGVLTDNLGRITVDEYIAELDKKGIIDGTTSTDEYGSTVVKTTSGIEVYIRQNGDSDLIISFEQIIIQPTLGELVTAADYGKTINYVADNGLSDWKVFYHTEDYVYLIASEMLEKDLMPTITGAIRGDRILDLGNSIKKNVGHIYWDADYRPEGTIVPLEAYTKWMAKWGDYTSGINGKCVSYFLNESIWNSFNNTLKYKDSNYDSYVKGAIGTPTLEMFVASWNAKRATETNTDKIELSISNDSTGYYINGLDDVTISTSDTLYVWSTITYSSIWLSAPAARNGATSIINMSPSGRLVRNAYYATTTGLRPVVCLSADIPANLGIEGETDFII